MNNYLIDIPENAMFLNDEPIKILDMKFCYIEINSETGEMIVVYAAHLENFNLITFAQRLSITKDEIVESNFTNSSYVCFSNKEGIIKPTDHTDLCTYLLYPNGTILTDFTLHEGKSDIIYGITIGEDSGKLTIVRFKVDHNILIGIYALYRAINNLNVDYYVNKFVNDWMVGDKYITDIFKNHSTKFVTGFELIDISKTTKIGKGKYEGIAVYRFYTVETVDSEFNKDFIMLIKYCSKRPIRGRKKAKTLDEISTMYQKIAHSVDKHTAQSIDLKYMYLFCINTGNMTILRLQTEKYDEFINSLKCIGLK